MIFIPFDCPREIYEEKWAKIKEYDMINHQPVLQQKVINFVFICKALYISV